MPSITITRSVPVLRSARVQQTEGIFDLPSTLHSETSLSVSLPLDERPWQVGLIVGPSGSGKSTIARELFPEALVQAWKWPRERSVLDAFPESMSIREITELLSSVGFSSPPSWLRPFHALSNGEQFRVTMAHALAQNEPLTVVDEFTSVVDRTVAQVASAAIAKTVRRRQQKFIAVSCHFDVVDWLDPDWIYQPLHDQFDWRLVQGRPTIDLRIVCVDKSAWKLFRRAHYLSADLANSARCYCAFWQNKPAAFLAMISFPHAYRPGWRIHRIVCLPDYQGVGIGVHLTSCLSSAYRATGKPVFITSSNPALIQSYARSGEWKMIRTPSRNPARSKSSSLTAKHDTSATGRLTAGFEYVGPPNVEHARGFGLIA